MNLSVIMPQGILENAYVLYEKIVWVSWHYRYRKKSINIRDIKSER